MKALLILMMLVTSFTANGQKRERKTSANDTTVYEIADRQPQFGKDESGFNKYIAKHLLYPEREANGDFQTSTVVKFVIEKDGSLSNIRFTNPQRTKFESKIAKLLKASPRWKPALMAGKPVRYRYTLPLLISIGVEN